jgi:hypothetical protein
MNNNTGTSTQTHQGSDSWQLKCGVADAILETAVAQSRSTHGAAAGIPVRISKGYRGTFPATSYALARPTSVAEGTYRSIPPTRFRHWHSGSHSPH